MGHSQVAVLSALTADDFYTLFKTSRGEDLRRIVEATLQFGRTGSDDQATKMISEHAEQALRRIAAESALNKRRVAKFGIKSSAPN